MHYTEKELLEIVSSPDKQIEYIKSKYGGYHSSNMAFFFKQRLSEESYSLVFKTVVEHEQFDDRIYFNIISSENTPMEWVLKFHEYFSNKDRVNKYISERPWIKKNQINKKTKEFLYYVDKALCINPNCPTDIFNNFVKIGFNPVILNDKLFSSSDFIDYLKEKNSKKQISKKEFSEIIGNVYNRHTLDTVFIDFLVNNSGDLIRLFDFIDYSPEYNNLLDNDFELLFYLFKQAMTSDILTPISIDKFVKRFIDSCLKIEEEFLFPEDILYELKENFPHIYNKKIIKIKKSSRKLEFKI